MIKGYLEKLGRSAGEFVDTAGLMSLMLFQTVIHAFTPPVKFRNIFKQMEFVGVQSLFVVILTGSFTGMVLALQSFNALKRFGAESLVGPTVALSMARELGPVLAVHEVTVASHPRVGNGPSAPICRTHGFVGPTGLGP